MYILKKLLIFGLLLISFRSLSQNGCQEDIDQSNKLFEDGAFREAEKLAKRTLETCELDKTQENEMLKLLASIYYEMDELELGDEYVERFINKNPYYIVSKRNDPVQFRKAIGKFKTFPRFSIGLLGGIPIGRVTTEKIYPVLDSANYNLGYTLNPTFQGGLDLCWNMNNYISFNIGAGVTIQKLIHQAQYYGQIYFNYQEQNISANFPVSLGFTLPISGSIESKIYMGGELDMFISGKYTYFYTGNVDMTSVYSNFLNRKKSNVKISSAERNNYRYAALAGVRLIYKVDKLGFFADFKYTKEYSLYNKPQKRYLEQDLFLSNNYALDDILLENFNISLGMVYKFSYKVKSKY